MRQLNFIFVVLNFLYMYLPIPHVAEKDKAHNYFLIGVYIV